MNGTALSYLSQIDASFYKRLDKAASGEASSSVAAAYQFEAEAQDILSNVSRVTETAIAQQAARRAAEAAFSNRGQNVDQVV